ncbi:collagen-like protein [Ginsengibacter hankyongi]|uniref:Collagen-like protein n=1 Tax=Ginsengibacter hankyongi TaxID=2607284 RepID=A0A5J5IEX7_9BACT|nr:collagen-like protein [Ginsengibacter hankyongi]KAA9037177.1 collagen-like protein [Ginsengibacter hankyongi]
MKQKILTVRVILLLAVIVIIASCSKTGPTGPAGATGAQGPAGPTGSTGATGAPGTANVIYSPWLNVKFVGADSTGWLGQISAPKLVDSIINRGDIKVFLNAGSDSANDQLIFPLPITDIAFTGAIINPYYQSQLINLLSTADVSSDSLRGYHYFQYRYILIPGGTTALPVSVGGTKKTINWNDYSQVKAYLGLKD